MQSCHVKVLIADEPTTAPDVTIQAQILDAAPTHSDDVCVRRAAKALALAHRIQACYVHACPECGAIRREGTNACCRSVRPMLAVALRDSRIRHLAPPPVRPVPSWIYGAPVVHPSVSCEVASAGMLDVLIECGLQRLRSGQMKISGRDLVGALRLRQQIAAANHPLDVSMRGEGSAWSRCARRC